jgi:hypothetical protein
VVQGIPTAEVGMLTSCVILKQSLLLHRCVALSLEAVANKDAELMVASHNQVSVENAVARMKDLNLEPSTSGTVSCILFSGCPLSWFPLKCIWECLVESTAYKHFFLVSDIRHLGSTRLVVTPS